MIQFITGQLAAAQAPAEGEMGPDGQPVDPAMAGAPDGQEPQDDAQEEPDYENMSVEELQAELDKMGGGSSAPAKAQAPQAKQKQPQAQARKSMTELRKSLELDL